MACPARMHNRVEELPEFDHEAWHYDPDDQVYRLMSKCATCGEVLYLDVNIFDNRLWDADTD
jgi:hypothetical protein